MTQPKPVSNRRATRHLAALLLWIPSLALALDIDDLPWPLNQSLSRHVYDQFTKYPAAKQYAFLAHINPFYLNGDFDGDGQLDVAVWIREKSSQKVGIAILHSGSGAVFVLAAGRSIGHGGDDFRRLDAWYVFRKGRVFQGADETKPPTLKGDALYVQKTEASSGLLYWEGKRYAWYQQGD